MLSAFTKKQPLSDREIEELQAILDQAKSNREQG
jgi:predicted transcriptional regulator